MSWWVGIWFKRSGNTGASPMLLPVTSTARTSSVSSSIPMCILRQIRRLEPSCLWAFHSPSPSTDRQGIACDVPRGCFDRGTVDQEVQRTSATAIRQTYVQHSLTTAKGAEIRHRPIQPEELQQALYKTCGLSQWQPEQYLQSETSLDRSVAEPRLSATLAARRRYPNHLGIKPD